MRRWVSGIALVCMAVSVLTACSSSAPTAADGLSLHAVTTLVRQARDGEHFEQLLNTSGINNLDLDGDGTIDYINIKEYGHGDFRGFSLSTTLHDGSIQQIAEIQFQRTLSGVIFQIHGNPQMYGHNYYIRSSQPLVATVGQALLLNWLFTPRVVYVSPYSRLYLPPAYAPIRVVPMVEYRKVTKTVVTTTQVNVQQVQKPIITTTVKSPNEGKSSSVVVAPLANPTQTQKQFQERPETKQIQQATGFAKPKPADQVKPSSVQGVQRPGTVQVPAPTGGVAPTTSGRTTTDKQFQERTDKEIPTAKGFMNKGPVPTAPAPVPEVSRTSPATPPADRKPAAPTLPSPAPSPRPAPVPEVSRPPSVAPSADRRPMATPSPSPSPRPSPVSPKR